MATSRLSRHASELVGVVLFATALLWVVALVSYSPRDGAWFFHAGVNQPPTNFAGQVGAFLAEFSFQSAGYTAYALPIVLCVVGWHYFWCREFDAPVTKAIGAALVFTCCAALLSLAFDTLPIGGRPFRAGGWFGAWAATGLAQYLNRTGALILTATVFSLALVLATQVSLGQVARRLVTLASQRYVAFRDRMREAREERARAKQREEVLKKHLEKGNARPEVLARAAEAPPRPARRPAPDTVPAQEPARAAASRREAIKVNAPPLPLAPPEPLGKVPAERRKGEFVLPPLTLLDAPRSERKIDERELMEAARLLEDKCREFAVDGGVVQIHPGPVVTTFEFKPDAGVKYSKVTALSDDLSLAMQAESVLIDRIPGKSTVGIQIPNANRETISLRDLLESDTFRRSAAKLPLALGKSIHGEPHIADLATMPHLLIAGSTGTGKSVGLNAMLTSILYRNSPDELRLIMIDPKRLELGMYEDIPHLLTPVVVEPKQAANALRWAVREMEERYKTLAGQNVRNIEQFNRNVRAVMEESGGKPPVDEETGEPVRPLPFIAGNEVEESICRLAQMARAVGIHLILATQRPSVDVITGLIKANLPARISFRVSSKTDSRTILDCNGAEQLLGRGDMLFLPPASSRVVRLHGPYISEQESARLASFLRKQGKPTYNMSITEDEKSGPEAMEFERDELYDEAARILVSSGQASISYLQRRLRIGFSRAARLVDMMEAEGLVSPGAGGKPREVLVPKDYFDEVDAQVR
ncbi:MAG: DNA translocase FtsK [Vicinamibacterales bacterium]|nr:DNA translocase FtsK [Vicinamibacterales bacterium]